MGFTASQRCGEKFLKEVYILMNITTKASIQNGYYGTLTYNSKKEKYIFEPLGKEVTIDEVYESLETREIFYVLSWDFFGSKKTLCIAKGDVFDSRLITKLTSQGADIPAKNYNVFLDSIRIQEESLANGGQKPKLEYSNLGWLEIPSKNGLTLCYRHNRLVGGCKADYVGLFDVEPNGTFGGWKAMVDKYVIGRPVLETVLIASLSAVVIGILSTRISVENPIVHLNCESGKGKSTAAILATSPYGKAYDGTITSYDKNKQRISKYSLYQSWGGTENALVDSLGGICGAVTVLNELGKFSGRNMTRLVFDFSEGSDKKRMNSKLSERYSTVIISTGESSLLEKCEQKFEGLQVRVMEITDALTESAEHSRVLKSESIANCGHAAPMLAEYILNNGGFEYVNSVYKDWRNKCETHFKKSYNSERFIEKFAALFLATADICFYGLGIKFSIPEIIEYLRKYDEDNSAKRNSSAESYEKIVEHCNVNRANFYTRKNKSNVTDNAFKISNCYGRISDVNYKLADGRYVVEEIEIFTTKVEEILKQYGFPNIKTCAKAWKNMGVLVYEKGHNTCKRKIVPSSNAQTRVYVFRVFADDKAEVAND